LKHLFTNRYSITSLMAWIFEI